MFRISTTRITLFLHDPEDGFYLGTRFDRSGVFDSILLDSSEIAGRWFERYDPYMHDAVCGPSEEFFPVFLDKGVVKIGIGLLQVPDVSAYDRFKLYDVIDAGEWNCFQNEESVTFRHVLKGVYEYEKVIALTGEKSFEIRHTLRSAVDLSGEMPNGCIIIHSGFPGFQVDAGQHMDRIRFFPGSLCFPFGFRNTVYPPPGKGRIRFYRQYP